MPLLILLILIILVAQIGFWDTLQAVIGGVLMIALLGVILVVLAGLVGRYFYRRLTGPP